MKIVKLLALAAVLAISPACKKDPKTEAKKEEPKKDPAKPDPAKPDPAKPDPAAGSNNMAGSAAATPTPPPPPAEDTADWIKVMATHVEANPADPVEVKFDKFKVTKANFDPKKIEGGTATIEIDVNSLKTNDAKRDEHLATPDYIDVKKNATITVDIVNVKKKDDKNFTADAKIKFRGVDKKYPVAFEVVEAKDDWIRVKGEHTFKRLDFKVGKKPGKDQKKGEDGVADEMTVKMQLTLKKT
jgi:polyisoprenoid-binding protein YceI